MSGQSAGKKKLSIVPEYSNIKYFRSRLRNWGKHNYDDFPWRSSCSQFHGLIAEIMLQRTKAEQVCPVFLDFTRKYPTPDEFFKITTNEAEDIFSKLGLLWRANQIFMLSHELRIRNGAIPNCYSELISLPGVGPYAANAFISFHLDRAVTIIDSNIVRLYTRYFGIPYKIEMRRNKAFVLFCESITPKQKCKQFNYSLLDFTRKVCKPKPLCETCVLKTKCIAVAPL